MTGRPRSQREWEPASFRNRAARSEEHTSELQSQSNLVCRLLLEKKKNKSCRRRPLSNPYLDPHPPKHNTPRNTRAPRRPPCTPERQRRTVVHSSHLRSPLRDYIN